jgi:hypothetical protein
MAEKSATIEVAARGLLQGRSRALSGAMATSAGSSFMANAQSLAGAKGDRFPAIDGSQKITFDIRQYGWHDSKYENAAEQCICASEARKLALCRWKSTGPAGLRHLSYCP